MSFADRCRPAKWIPASEIDPDRYVQYGSSEDHEHYWELQ